MRDPVETIERREGVKLNERQAAVLRRRVEEVRASLQRWADFRGTTVAVEARARLETIREGRLRSFHGFHTPDLCAVVGPGMGLAAHGRDWFTS